MVERQLLIGTSNDRFRLTYCREAETSVILDHLTKNLFVFLYGSAGNGKTSFGIEFREKVPNSSLILAAQLETKKFKVKGLYDTIFESADIIIVDEFGSPFGERKVIDQFIASGKRFIFMVHFPKSRYIYWREQHQSFDPLIMGLIADYPNVPWIHLQKYQNRKIV